MKHTLNAILFVLILAGVSLAQSISAPGHGDVNNYKPRIAVLEFNAAPKAAAIGTAGTQSLQNGIAAALSAGFDVADIVKTNAMVGKEPLTLNEAVRIGKLLGVDYMMAGYVGEYGAADRPGIGRMMVRAELIDVATGRAKWFGEVRFEAAGISKIGAGTLDMTEKVMKPSIQRLTASLKAADL